MDILFWSGGKDAYLALELYRQNHPETIIKLLTTYDESSAMVPHQQIPIANIKTQAKTLNLNLSLIPLPKKCPNDEYLNEINKALTNQSKPVEHLIFGDWYLQDIREWREKQFNNLGFECRFPIWKKSLDELLPILLFKAVEVRISAVAKKYEQFIKVGEPYNQPFIRQLPREIDPMGERGEFHTEVFFQKPGSR